MFLSLIPISVYLCSSAVSESNNLVDKALTFFTFEKTFTTLNRG